MSSVEYIKSEIERLYKTSPDVHVSMRLTHPKVIEEQTPARIVGVYGNIFQIEKGGCSHPSRSTFRYTDVLCGKIEIHELDFEPTADKQR